MPIKARRRLPPNGVMAQPEQNKMLRCFAWLQVLNVAEKNSVAVQVSSALSNSSAHRQASWCACKLHTSCVLMFFNQNSLSTLQPGFLWYLLRARPLTSAPAQLQLQPAVFLSVQYQWHAMRNGVHLGVGAPARAGLPAKAQEVAWLQPSGAVHCAGAETSSPGEAAAASPCAALSLLQPDVLLHRHCLALWCRISKQQKGTCSSRRAARSGLCYGLTATGRARISPLRCMPDAAHHSFLQPFCTHKMQAPSLSVLELQALGGVNSTLAFVQVIEVCRRANPRLVVKRARFSALVRAQLERAVAQLVDPDEAASKAIDARQEIDLRIGASFTRFQTLLLQVTSQSAEACPRMPCALRPQAVQADEAIFDYSTHMQVNRFTCRTNLTSAHPACKEIERSCSSAMDPASSQPWG